VVEPPTRQKPHPPLWMAAGSAASIRFAAEHGCHLILDQFAAIEVIGERIARYKAQLAAPSQMQVTVARDMQVTKSPAEKEAALARCRNGRQQILSVSRWPGQAGGSHILAYADSPEELEDNSLIGSPEEIFHKVEQLRKAGAEYLILSCGGSRESLRALAREIMPAFSAAAAVS
jgi:alkanesulfonate monooxygenase SsuD/methylene tetrahydromethanopterin reductase-like flavin-dependent oxidoreductase (luciferase family)